ncbi:MAG: hypothetical protein R6X02_12000 [Enhygromyxa sp.]
MQPIRLRPLHTLTSTLAALLLVAGCDGEALDELPIEEAPDDEHEPPFFAAEVDYAPPSIGEPEAPLDLLADEHDGTLIASGSDFRVRLHRSRRVAELIVSRDHLARWYSRPLTRWAPEATQRIYEVFADDFDFIVMVPASEGQHPALLVDGDSVRVSNRVEGLGMTQFDKTAWYGSEGRLQSVVLLGGIKHVVGGPSLRELGKRWGNVFIPTVSPDHFGFSDVGGQLGGCAPDEMEYLGHGRWYCDFNGGTNWSPDGATHNDRPYGRLELYLMGLLGPGAVPPVSWADDGEWVNADLGVFSGTVRTATIDELRATHGERFPDHLDSQKQFRTLFVVISGGDMVDMPMFDSFDSRVAEFAAPEAVINEQPGLFNFFEATSGLATLDPEQLDASLR